MWETSGVGSSCLDVIKSNTVNKIVDKEHVVGIITSGNQFVPVIPEVYDNRINDIDVETTYNIENKLLLDERLLKTKKSDIERKLIVKKLTLENNFYNIFRNTLKIILNYKTNTDKKFKLKEIINDLTLTYVEKMDKIMKILKNLLSNVTKFQKFKLKSLQDYDEMVTCIGKNRESCSGMKHCLLREENGICRLILPKKNLYSKIQNKIYYFVKLSDELIRFPQIRKYIFTPKSFLSFHHVKYSINNDEIILLEEILDKYFDNLKLKKENKYISYDSVYELAKPNISEKFSEVFELKTKQKKKSKKIGKRTL